MDPKIEPNLTLQSDVDGLDVGHFVIHLHLFPARPVLIMGRLINGLSQTIGPRNIGSYVTQKIYVTKIKMGGAIYDEYLFTCIDHDLTSTGQHNTSHQILIYTMMG